MTPSDKAQELVNKMAGAPEHLDDIGMYIAKQCALIAVNEILSVNWQSQEDAYYWNSVKKEIEKL